MMQNGMVVCSVFVCLIDLRTRNKPSKLMIWELPLAPQCCFKAGTVYICLHDTYYSKNCSQIHIRMATSGAFEVIQPPRHCRHWNPPRTLDPTHLALQRMFSSGRSSRTISWDRVNQSGKKMEKTPCSSGLFFLSTSMSSSAPT